MQALDCLHVLQKMIWPPMLKPRQAIGPAPLVEAVGLSATCRLVRFRSLRVSFSRILLTIFADRRKPNSSIMPKANTATGNISPGDLDHCTARNANRRDAIPDNVYHL